MQADEEFEAKTADGPDAEGEAGLVVRLDGFEGPLDLLLSLAREQKVDLTRISILALAEQYLAYVQAARHLRLEVAAEYIVMAAWLAYLKSRLLLPHDAVEEDEPSGEEMAAALRFQLQRLEAMREAATRLIARPRLGVEVFGRGQPEGLALTSHTVYHASLFDLLSAYGAIKRRVQPRQLRIAPEVAWSIERALARLRALLPGVSDWATLTSLLPSSTEDEFDRRSALAATFGATLELAKSGSALLRQDAAFGAIYVRLRAAAQVFVTEGQG
ncbi:MAG: segregation/condensation protein A [Alphaproteobacteria bacterium]|nr:segregation/condensation protein A [Alphaproteobacteria bacterium]